VLGVFGEKKKDPVYTEESFADAFLSTTGFVQKSTPVVNSTDFEIGLEFKPTVKGKLTSLLVKLPDVRTNLRITIWDKATTSAIKTEIVNVAAANTQYNFDIADIELEKDKEYVISMNSNDYYIREKTDGSAVKYPVTAGNIIILSYKYINGTTQKYPSASYDLTYAGDCFFKFVQTN
jgi:hypothetical protein